MIIWLWLLRYGGMSLNRELKKIPITLFLIIFSTSLVSMPLNSNDLKTAQKLSALMYRSLLTNEKGDEILQINTDLEYFFCEGSGTTTTFIDGYVQELPNSNYQSELIIAFNDRKEGEPATGLLALSQPDFIGNGWLVVSSNIIKENAWMDVWDSKYNFEEVNDPLIDSVKGTINDFVLRIDLNPSSETEEWELIGDDMYLKDVSLNASISMNRNKLNYYEQFTKIRKGKTKNLSFDLLEETSAEGTCSRVER